MALEIPEKTINPARKEIYHLFYDKYWEIYKYLRANFKEHGEILFYAENSRINNDLISFKVLYETRNASYILNCINIDLSVSLFFHDVDVRLGEVGISDIKNVSSLFNTLDRRECVYIKPQWKFSWSNKYFNENLGKFLDSLTESRYGKWVEKEEYKFCKFLSYVGSEYPHINKIDELGEIINISNYVNKLRCIDIPFVGNTYTLVGENYHAKHTTKNHIECVLFAETDNEHDVNAIKVLRWFPKKRSSETMNLSNLFFDLGYISRDENEDLHNFMVNNQSRILFGKIINGKITIIGGIKMFLNSKYIFPKALHKIEIV